MKIVQNASHFLGVTGEMGIVANPWNANVTMDTLVISANMQIVQQDATHNMATALILILVGVIQVCNFFCQCSGIKKALNSYLLIQQTH